GSLLFSVALLPIFGAQSRGTAEQWDELGRRMATIDRPLDATAGPVITDVPIWLAETARIPSLALPEEPPADVLDLARDPAFPGTRYLIVMDPERWQWPPGVDGPIKDADCCAPVDLGPGPAGGDDPLADVRVFE